MSLNYRTYGKPGFHGTFQGELEGEYAMWVKENIMGRNKKVVLMTLIVTLMGTVTRFGPRHGVGFVPCF